MTPPISRDDHLGDFTRRQIILDGIVKTVYMTGTEPRVIIITGMSDANLRMTQFAR